MLAKLKASVMEVPAELLQLEAVRALANNTKVFFGDKLPNIFMTPAGAARGGRGYFAAESAVYILLVTQEQRRCPQQGGMGDEEDAARRIDDFSRCTHASRLTHEVHTRARVRVQIVKTCKHQGGRMQAGLLSRIAAQLLTQPGLLSLSCFQPPRPGLRVACGGGGGKICFGRLAAAKNENIKKPRYPRYPH